MHNFSQHMNNVRNGFDHFKRHIALNQKQIQIQNIWTPINSTKSEISNLEKLKKNEGTISIEFGEHMVLKFNKAFTCYIMFLKYANSLIISSEEPRKLSE